MHSAIHWGNVRWKLFIGSFTPTACLVALTMLILILTPASPQLLISLLALILIVQAISINIVTHSITDPPQKNSTEATDDADEECNESELTFSPVFHANPLPTSLTTLDEGRYVGVNDAWIRLFGYSCADAIGNTSLGLNIWVHPEERLKLAQQLRATGSVRDFEHLARTKSGDVRNVLVSAEAIDFNGTRYNLSLVHDITERKHTEEEVRRQNICLEALHQVSLGIVAELDVNELLSTIVERAVELIGASYGWVYLVTPAKDALELCVATGVFRQYTGTWLKCGEGLAGHIWQTGQALAVDDYQIWPGRSYQFEGDPVRAAIGMPLKASGQVVGVIGLTRTTPGAPFDQGEQDLATRFGNLASIALVNARLHTSLQAELSERKHAKEALEHRLAFEQLITGISSEFVNLKSDQIDSAIEQSLAAIGRFTESDRSYVYRFSDDGTRMDNLYEWCRAHIMPLKRLYRDQPINLLPWTTDQIKRGQVVHIPVLANLPPEAQDDRARMLSHADAPLSFINVPMTYRGRVVGLLGFDAVRAEKTWNEDTIALLRIVGEIFVSALERKRTDKALEERLAFERLITNISTEFINLESDQIDASIEQALAAIGRFTGSDRSYVFLFSADGTQMDNPHEWCRAGIESHQHLFRNQPIQVLPWAIPKIQQGQVVHISSFRTLPREAHVERELTQTHTQPTLSVIAVPVAWRGRVFGLLGFDSVHAEKTWSEDSIALLRVVGEIFVNALEHKHTAEALRKSEARFRTMFDSAAIGIAIVDVNGKFAEINPAFAQMTGFSQAELSRMTMTEYTHPDDLPAQFALEKEIQKGERDHYQIEKRYVRKDGQIVWGRMTRSIARNTQGEMLFEIGMVEDITAQKLAAQKLEEAYRTLEQRVAERTQELATLNAIAATVNRSLDLKEIMCDALARLIEITGMDGGVAYRLETTDGDFSADAYLQPLAHQGVSDEFIHFDRPLRLRRSAVETAAQQGAPVVWQVLDTATTREIKQALDKEGIRQVVSIPLLAKGRLVGALQLGTKKIRAFPPEQLALLGTIGQQIGVAVENARLYEQAERSAQVAERSRLARELHDSVTQSLYSMTLYAEATARLLMNGEHQQAAGHLRELRDTAQEALREMRLLIFELRPPALENGLAAALQTRLDSVESRGGVHAELRVEGTEPLTFAVQSEVYNIALEALNNALKHTRARAVHVHLRFLEDVVCLEIKDDGVGFELTIARRGGGYGISGMQERAERIGGKIEIISTPGKGTQVNLRVPLTRKETKEQ